MALEADREAIEFFARAFEEQPILRSGKPRAKHDADHWARVADFYRAHAGIASASPTLAVAEEWKVSKTAAAKWIAKCRARGLLPPTQKGVARG
jgi:hypothetical protein